MFTEGQNLAIVRTELDYVFYQEFNYDDNNPVMARATNAMIFRQESIDRAQWIGETFSGVGLYPKIGETQTVPSSVPIVTNKQTTSIADFAQKVELSKDLFDDNMHGVWSRVVQDMALKARVTQDQNAFGLFRNAFSGDTAPALTADGVSIVNASHPLIGGGTISNLISGALTPTTLNTGIVALAEQKDQRGVILGQQPAVLLVPTALVKTALEITDSALVSDTSTNAINVYRSAYGFRVYASPYIGLAAGGTNTRWFLLGRNHGIYRIVRQGIQTALRSWEMSDNRTYLYQANFREEVVAVDYVGVVGSPGL